MIVVERRDVVINDIMIANMLAIYEYYVAQLSAAALELLPHREYGSHGGPTQMVAVEFVNHCKKLSAWCQMINGTGLSGDTWSGQ